MKKAHSNLKLVLMLLAFSFVFYLIQFFVFHSIRDTSFYFLQDMAFLPLQVAIVTLVLNQFISDREKQDRLKKMNMAITAFFGEAGTDLLLFLNKFVTNPEDRMDMLNISGKWNDKDFQKAAKIIAGYDFQIDSRKSDLEELKHVLIEKRLFLLSMLENSNLLEHDTFTEMLWAVFHIMDELVSRERFSDLPDTDLDHLSVDIERAYRTLIVEWVHYAAHLKNDYPYLFSLAVRKNPFNENRSVVIGSYRNMEK